jgi:hypothetical protein
MEWTEPEILVVRPMLLAIALPEQAKATFVGMSHIAWNARELFQFKGIKFNRASGRSHL